MAAEPWVDPTAMIWAGSIGGSLVGLWGAALGTAGSTLVPRGKGKPLVFGMLFLGAAVGVMAFGFGLAALVAGQPYPVWYAPLLGGVLLLGLSVPFVFVMRHRYRQVELRRMSAEELG
jgi:hypothetical protein